MERPHGTLAAHPRAAGARHRAGCRPPNAAPAATCRASLDIGLGPSHPPDVRKKAPHFALARVKDLAARPDGLFIQRGRALDFFPTFAEAYAVVRRVVAGLSEADFGETVKMTYDLADVYGVRVEGAGWYLKVTVDESVPEVAVISFHPPERPLKTNGGTVKP